MKKKLNGILLLLLTVPVLLIAGCSSSADSDLIKAQKISDYNTDQYKDMEATGVLEDGVRVIHIKAWQYRFEPTLIVVNKGEKIRLIVEAMDVPHGFELHGLDLGGYNINSIIRKGMPAVIEFTADEKGLFQFICSIYCGFGHSKMKGTFIVR